MSAPTPYQLFGGVDIAKATATVAWAAPAPAQFTIPQTPAGYTTLLRRARRHGGSPGGHPRRPRSDQHLLAAPRPRPDRRRGRRQRH